MVSKDKSNKKLPILKTFSHFIMGGIMLMFFIGVGLGIYSTIFLGESVSTTLDYIMKLAYIVTLGYFVKAFGENIAKIVLGGIFGNKSEDINNISDNNLSGGGGI